VLVQNANRLNLNLLENLKTYGFFGIKYAPTPDLFSADSMTGEIQKTLMLLLNQFEQRMTEINTVVKNGRIF
jgi:hypothetical protein